MKGLCGMLKYIMNYGLYLAHYDAYFHINDDAKWCRYLIVTNIFYSLIIHLNCSHIKYCKKSALPLIHSNKNYLFL